MYVGIMQVDLELAGPRNLKERRSIVNSLRDRIRKRFQAAVADVGPQTVYTELTLGISVVSNEARHARARCDAILAWLESQPAAQVLECQTEIL